MPVNNLLAGIFMSIVFFVFIKNSIFSTIWCKLFIWKAKFSIDRTNVLWYYSSVLN